MNSITQLMQAGLLEVPGVTTSDICYDIVGGSQAYGTYGPESDCDLFAVVNPASSWIAGYDNPDDRFSLSITHHIKDADGNSYDATIYNLPDFVHAAEKSNVYALEMLFVPNFCVMGYNNFGARLWLERNRFLSKRTVHAFMGTANSHYEKMSNIPPSRKDLIHELGYDTKRAYHVIRLLLQAKGLLEDGTLTLDQNTDVLLKIRTGELSFEDFREMYRAELVEVTTKLKSNKVLPGQPNHDEIRKILVDCMTLGT